MLLTNRKDARTNGDRFYLPDKPCRHGHLSPRYVSTGHCSECLAAARGADQQAHRQAMAARFDGATLFAYRLHPDDHAAAQAFCQALDMQRGRVPTTASNVGATPNAQASGYAPNEITRRRDEVYARLAAERKAATPTHFPAEFAAVIRADER